MFLSKLKTALATGLAALGLLVIGYGMLAAQKHTHEAHPGDPVKQEEHTALFELAADSQATHTAVAEGVWGDPKTWDKKTVPSGKIRGSRGHPQRPHRHRCRLFSTRRSAWTGCASMARCASTPRRTPP